MSLLWQGKAWVFGDDVPNDEGIMPLRLVRQQEYEPAALAPHCFEQIDASFAGAAQRGDIVFGGRNFGYGNPHIQGFLGLKGLGVGLVVDSMSRGPLRACVNAGVPVLIVAGAGATAMCADLGSRTIRDEIAAMEVLGINPVQRLVTPRMLASGLVALLLNSLVVIIGILGGYVFSVFVQDVNPGAFAAGITLITGTPEVIISCVKAALFGVIAGLVACYRGLMISGGGAKAVGNAVNETVVYAFMALFVVNVVVTAVGIRLTTG